MSHDPKMNPKPANGGPAWSELELFCIHSYAGESGPPCGWRGKAADVVRFTPTGERRCPRCGRPTLMEIPPATDEVS